MSLWSEEKYKPQEKVKTDEKEYTESKRLKNTNKYISETLAKCSSTSSWILFGQSVATDSCCPGSCSPQICGGSPEATTGLSQNNFGSTAIRAPGAILATTSLMSVVYQPVEHSLDKAIIAKHYEALTWIKCAKQPDDRSNQNQTLRGELSPKNGIKFGGRISQSSWRQEVIQRLEDEALQQIHRANLHITQFFAEKLLYLRSFSDFTYLENEQCTTGKENRNEANSEILRGVIKPIIYDLQHLLIFAIYELMNLMNPWQNLPLACVKLVLLVESVPSCRGTLGASDFPPRFCQAPS